MTQPGGADGGGSRSHPSGPDSSHGHKSVPLTLGDAANSPAWGTALGGRTEHCLPTASGYGNKSTWNLLLGNQGSLFPSL